MASGTQADGTAEDPNSLCHGIVAVTIGASALDRTRLTDEAGL
ncbi:hypothetical protein ACWFR5_31945 [Streptomyces sp. NPDC055092]